MIFIIFSYNRGEFLANCVQSLETCVDEPEIVIFDDNSDDADTQRLLASYQGRYQVWQPKSAGNHRKHGGLYSNMQQAFEQLGDDNLFCFLQDDMQVVRPISQQEIAQIEQYFVEDEQRGWLYPILLKGQSREQEQASLQFQVNSNTYIRQNYPRKVGTFYSDVVIGHVANLRKHEWYFAQSEPTNEQLAAKCLHPMGIMHSPFAMYLPCVPAYRGKVKTWAMQQAEKQQGCGLYPYNIMSPEQRDAYITRDHQQLPIAEDILQTAAQLSKPWVYYPLQNKKWLRKLNSLEVKLRRLLPGG